MTLDNHFPDTDHLPIRYISLKHLYEAPLPLLLTRDDGRLLIASRLITEITGRSASDLPYINEWSTVFSGPPLTTEKTIHYYLCKAASSAISTDLLVQTLDGIPRIWRFFTIALGGDTNGHAFHLSIGEDIGKKVTSESHLKEIMAQLEQEIAARTSDLNTIIDKLQKEVLEKNRISESLTISRERLKKISRHTLDILEADRRTISKELHDSLGASLAAIKFSLEGKELQRQRGQNQLTESLDQEVQHLAAAIKETKRISANLRPSLLDELGLEATIRWYIRQYQRLYNHISIQYHSEIAETDVPESMKINIYRIIQEGLTNVERHSQASEIRLSLKYCDGRQSLSLGIEDNGCGFDIQRTLANKDPLGGYGLIAMRERCEIFGGMFHLDSESGKGTRINAILPLT